MSTWNTYLTIKNNFNAELSNGTPHITSGTLSGRLPDPIHASGGTQQIQVNAENGDMGSSGRFDYDIVIGTNKYTLSITFVCDNRLQNSVTCKSPQPSLLKVEVSPYAQDDHPLRATISLSAV